MVERSSTEHRGIDIALLREYPSGGIGTMLIEELLVEAAKAGKPFRISVVRNNSRFSLLPLWMRLPSRERFISSITASVATV